MLLCWYYSYTINIYHLVSVPIPIPKLLFSVSDVVCTKTKTKRQRQRQRQQTPITYIGVLPCIIFQMMIMIFGVYSGLCLYLIVTSHCHWQPMAHVLYRLSVVGVNKIYRRLVMLDKILYNCN